MSTKTFRLGAVLSVTTGTLLCEIGDVYAILNHMTGDNLFTHQLPRAMRECRPFLLRQFPSLPHASPEDVGPENWARWLHARIQEHGDSFDVAPIPPQQHDRIDPLTELAGMVGPDRVAVVVAPNKNSPAESAD